jgi:hypothetical protein
MDNRLLGLVGGQGDAIRGQVIAKGSVIPGQFGRFLPRKRLGRVNPTVLPCISLPLARKTRRRGDCGAIGSQTPCCLARNRQPIGWNG